MSDGSTFESVDTVRIAVGNPSLALPGGPLNYTASDPLTLIDPGAIVTDPDSPDFDTGTLTIDFTAGGTANDRLKIDESGDFNLQGSFFLPFAHGMHAKEAIQFSTA